jgi:hypothetical protein
MESKMSKMSLEQYMNNNTIDKKIEKEDIGIYLNRLAKMKGVQMLLAIGHLPLELSEGMIRQVIENRKKSNYSEVDKMLIRFFKRGLIYDDNELIGYTINGKGHCYLEGNWSKCDGVVPSKNIEQIIVGLIEEDSNGKTIFKTRPAFKGDNKDKDKRTIKTGTVCKTSSKSTLLDITNSLGIKHKKKITVTRLCRKIERTLRAKQLEADKKGNGYRWIYDTYEN